MSLAESLEILFEDNHCLAVNKPSGWPCTHYDGGEETVDRLVKDFLREKYHKPGNVFLGVVHRLDKPVTGVLLFARTSKAAARIAEQFRAGAVEKVYWAVVEGAPMPSPQREPGESAGTFENWLIKNDEAACVAIAPQGTPNAKHAITHYYVRSRYGGLTLLELRPQTGRKHQLRVQLASRGMPVYGDSKYGSYHSFGPAIGLHACSLTFLHPVKLEPVTITAELPPYWKGRFAHLLKPEAAK